MHLCSCAHMHTGAQHAHACVRHRSTLLLEHDAASYGNPTHKTGIGCTALNIKGIKSFYEVGRYVPCHAQQADTAARKLVERYNLNFTSVMRDMEKVYFSLPISINCTKVWLRGLQPLRQCRASHLPAFAASMMRVFCCSVTHLPTDTFAHAPYILAAGAIQSAGSTLVAGPCPSAVARVLQCACTSMRPPLPGLLPRPPASLPQRPQQQAHLHGAPALRNKALIVTSSMPNNKQRCAKAMIPSSLHFAGL